MLFFWNFVGWSWVCSSFLFTSNLRQPLDQKYFSWYTSSADGRTDHWLSFVYYTSTLLIRVEDWRIWSCSWRSRVRVAFRLGLSDIEGTLWFVTLWIFALMEDAIEVFDDFWTFSAVLEAAVRELIREIGAGVLFKVDHLLGWFEIDGCFMEFGGWRVGGLDEVWFSFGLGFVLLFIILEVGGEWRVGSSGSNVHTNG